ncbi:MAG: hypothetical protein ABR541_02835 [Candidatus Dormibacteria bacterium]
MSPEQRADLAERSALERYLAMRELWAPCWGARRTTAEPRRTRPRTRSAGG